MPAGSKNVCQTLAKRLCYDSAASQVSRTSCRAYDNRVKWLLKTALQVEFIFPMLAEYQQ